MSVKCWVDVSSSNVNLHPSQGQLYVIGGSNGHSDELSCGERYDPQADEWAQVPELRTNRCNAGQSLLPGLLILMISVQENA